MTASRPPRSPGKVRAARLTDLAALGELSRLCQSDDPATRSLGLPLPYRDANDVRQALAAAMPGTPYVDAAGLVFTRPVPARNWLQASNPSERWKWDFLFQDLPPVKGHSVQTEGLPPEIAFIPLKPVG